MKLRLAKIGLMIWLFAMLMGFLRINRVNEVDFAALTDAVTKEFDLSEKRQADHNMLKKLYGLEQNDFINGILYLSVNNMDVEELLLIEMKSEEQAQQVENSIQKRVKNQKDSFEGYGIEQTKLISDHVMSVERTYALFTISPNAEGIQQTFYRILHE